jgi:hypothetical protein
MRSATEIPAARTLPAASTTAAELAARIQIPRRLPPRYLSVVRAVNTIWLLGFGVAGMSSTRAW